jgi:hypothetical protein
LLWLFFGIGSHIHAQDTLVHDPLFTLPS